MNCNGDYSKYDGKYDNLLYYYAFNYKLIQHAYQEGEKKGLEFFHIPGYIQSKWLIKVDLNKLFLFTC